MSAESEKVYLAHRGTFKGHNGWVNKIAVAPNRDDLLVSASRDKTLIVWKITDQDGTYDGYAMRSLVGHNHFVTDCALSNDTRHAISSSWDRYLRMWDLENNCVRTLFRGHTADVLSVGFSSDNRQIFSSSRNGDILLWNIVGQIKFKFDNTKGSHNSSVNSLSLCANSTVPLMASAGSDKTVRLWNYTTGQMQVIHYGHTNVVNTVDLFNRGTHLASGGKDGIVNVWDTNNHLLCGSSQLPDEISCVKFNPVHPYLAAASGSKIFIFNIESCNKGYMDDTFVSPEDTERQLVLPPYVRCTTLVWSRDGRTIFAGFTDSTIRAFTIEPKVA